jgi:hypothetical protein
MMIFFTKEKGKEGRDEWGEGRERIAHKVII